MQSLDVGRPSLAGSRFGVDADNEADIKVKHPAACCGASGAPIQVRTGLLSSRQQAGVYPAEFFMNSWRRLFCYDQLQYHMLIPGVEL